MVPLVSLVAPLETGEQSDLLRVARFVTIQRGANGSFGFSVGGGVEDDQLPSLMLKRDSPALLYSEGEGIKDRDEFVAVNGVIVCGAPHGKVIEEIKKAKASVRIAIFNRPSTMPRRKLSEYFADSSKDDFSVFVRKHARDAMHAATVPVTTRPKRAGRRRPCIVLCADEDSLSTLS